MTDAPRQFWIGVVSREHVRLGVKGGFIQLGHGKKAPLQRLRAGDALAMYSPRTAYPDGEPLQAFTAIGVVTTGRQWGAAFRFGQIKIPADDFELIAKAMGVDTKLNENPARARATKQRPEKPA